MAGMYPEERTLTIDGETVSFPGLKDGKFTMGNPENPDEKPSFITPETINLLVDNISVFLSFLGITPNNKDSDQMKTASLMIISNLSLPTFRYLERGDRRTIRIRESVYLTLTSDSIKGLWLPAGTEFTEAQLDTGAAFIAGKHYYIYIVDTNGTLSVTFSLNSTYPTGYSSITSRKIGGFETLGISIGLIGSAGSSGWSHSLSGAVAGDILPCSVWDLYHRPVCTPEGFVYDSGMNKWVSIYLISCNEGSGNSLPSPWTNPLSAYGSSFLTGNSTPKIFQAWAEQWLGLHKMQLPSIQEFYSLSALSNQGTNVMGSANPITAGGHVDTDNRRMISDIGCEDCCGVIWQCGCDVGGSIDTNIVENFNAEESTLFGIKGFRWFNTARALFGGCWNNGSKCGSRAISWTDGAVMPNLYSGIRAVAEPLHRQK